MGLAVPLDTDEGEGDAATRGVCSGVTTRDDSAVTSETSPVIGSRREIDEDEGEDIGEEEEELEEKI